MGRGALAPALSLAHHPWMRVQLMIQVLVPVQGHSDEVAVTMVNTGTLALLNAGLMLMPWMCAATAGEVYEAMQGSVGRMGRTI